MISSLDSSTQLHGKWKIIFQGLWWLLAVLMLADFAIGVPIRYRTLLLPIDAGQYTNVPGFTFVFDFDPLSRLRQPEVNALESAGFSIEFYAGFILAFDLALMLICTLAGLIIAWRKPEDWLALWVSFILILLGTHGASLVVPSISLVLPGWILVSSIFGYIGMISNVYLLFISPNGRFEPRWGMYLAFSYTIIMSFVAGFALIAYIRSDLLLLIVLLFASTPGWLLLSAIGVLFQVYRYLKVSDQVQRQQAKWVALGLAAVTSGMMVNTAMMYFGNTTDGLSRVIVNMLRALLVNSWMTALPLCLAISILRFRLWDIDLIIRRTLQYSLLTGLLSLAYFGGVALLQAVLRGFGGQTSTMVIVITTLTIAALFNPLRHRVQDFIDRRFYRQKYDAEKALAEFNAFARNETDLGQLSQQLNATVKETLQPVSTTLWLVKTQNYRKDFS